jgi:NAD(P)-dependent dehydrogenase (short-subunit alcohol dehydrogenase family)
MAGPRLTGKVAIVPVSGHEPLEPLARRLAGEGAAVVLLAGPEGLAAAGRFAAVIEAAGTGRAAVFVLDPARPDDLDGLVELVAELFG